MKSKRGSCSSLSLIFALTYLLGSLLSRFRIPIILAALFVGMALSYTPFVPFFFFIVFGMNIEVGAFAFDFYPVAALLAAAGKVIGTYFSRSRRRTGSGR